MALETGGKSFDKGKESAPKNGEIAKELIVSKDRVKERSKHQREANNKNEDVVWTYDEHELGKWEIADEKRVQAQAIKKGLDSRAIGGVDATSFNADKIDQTMILKMTDWADKFANLFIDGKIVSNFKTLNSVKTQGDMLSAIDEIALVGLKVKQGRFDMKEFKTKMEAKYGREMLYGPQGAFNILLAIHRADEAIKGKDVGKYIYDLRVGRKKLSQAERFSELRQSRPGTGPGEAGVVDAQNEHQRGLIEADQALVKLKSKYEDKYGAKIEIDASSAVKFEYLATFKVDTAEGISRTFYFRVKREGSKVVYLLSKVSIRGETVYSSVGEALGAFNVNLENFLVKSKEGKKKEDEKSKKGEAEVEVVEQVKFLENLGAFFSGDYLKEFYPDVAVSTKANGNYAGGVEIKGAKYALHIGKETYFVFVDLAARSVEFKTVEEVGTNKFGIVTHGEIKAGDLKTDTDKMNFALNVKKLLGAVNK